MQVFNKEHGSHLSLQDMVRLSEAHREAHDIKSENENPTKSGEDKLAKKFVRPAEAKSTQNFSQNTVKKVNEKQTDKKTGKRACYGCGSEQHMLRHCSNKKDVESGHS